MSTYSNKRHDAFGGDLNGRMHFPLQIIRRIRREVGDGFPLGFRYSGNEYVPDGRTIDKSRRIAPMLVTAGEYKDIRPCIGCIQSCINRGIIEGKPASCIYNTSAGVEMDAEIRRAEKAKRILVVGGGPGGLEAARNI